MSQRGRFVRGPWRSVRVVLLLAALSASACGVTEESSDAGDAEVSDGVTRDQSVGDDASSGRDVLLSQDRVLPVADRTTSSDAAGDDARVTGEDALRDEGDGALEPVSTSSDGAPDGNAVRPPADSGAYFTPLAASCDAIAPPGVHLDAVVDLTIGQISGIASCTVGLLHTVTIHQVLCGSVRDGATLDYGYFPSQIDPKPGERLLLGLQAQQCRPNLPPATRDVFNIAVRWRLVDRDGLVTRLTGSADAGATTSTDGGTNTPCQCTGLPNVKPDAVVACRDGQCAVAPSDCSPEWGHCSNDPTDGCETVFSRTDTCGSCSRRCAPPEGFCTLQGDGWACGERCGLETDCSCTCADLSRDPSHCGDCATVCRYPGVDAPTCTNGVCGFSECAPRFGDCNGSPGCETPLDTLENCGACGRRACQLANTVTDCSAPADSCTSAVCNAGFANCDLASADCETAWTTPTATCLPRYLSTVSLSPGRTGAVAVGPDGSSYAGGLFLSAADFDPSAASDVRTPAGVGGDAFVTKLGPSGAYEWTRTMPSNEVSAMSVVADGSVYVGATSTAAPPAAGNSPALVWKLAADGSTQWARTIDVGAASSAIVQALAQAADGSVILAGVFKGTIDLDPGPASDIRSSAADLAPFVWGTFVIKLSPEGDLVSGRALSGAPECQPGVVGVGEGTGEAVMVIVGVPLGCSAEPTVSAAATSSRPFSGAAIFSLSPAGDRVTLFDGLELASALVEEDKSLVLAGRFSRTTDFDPRGAGARRTPSATASDDGFVLRLTPEAAFRSVRVLPGRPVSRVASAPGGVLVAGYFYGDGRDTVFVDKLSEQSSSWSLVTATSSATTATGLASSSTGFIVSGDYIGATDFDPGPAMDVLSQPSVSTFVSRFAF